jgi:hypothetical protein
VECFGFARLLAVLLDVTFFLVDRLFPRWGFFRSPVRTSTNELTALFATSTAASTLALAASPMASWALGVRVPSLSLPPSLSFSIVASFVGCLNVTLRIVDYEVRLRFGTRAFSALLSALQELEIRYDKGNSTPRSAANIE